MSISYINLDNTKSFAALAKAPRYRYESFSPERVSKYDIAAGSYRYNFAAKAVDERTLALLYELGGEQQLIEKYRALAGGEVMNTGEGRMVLHHALRGNLTGEVVKDGRNYHAFYKAEREKIREFSRLVRAGKLLSSAGEPFTHFVQIGIGGSDLGPRALYIALQEYAQSRQGEAGRFEAHFISNVDPDDAAAVLRRCVPKQTLFMLVSKSGTTQETLTNEAFALKWLSDAGIKTPKKHIVAITSETSPLAKSADYLQSFFIDDFIGGRYSATSGVGLCMLDLAFGDAITDELLSGAHEADKAALEADLSKNAAATDALIGVYERNVLGYPYTAVLPYSQAMARFPAHLQQLDMESNGKQVSRAGAAITYSTGPVVFGEPGTNGQHSFYQLLHQGTDIVPLQFVGFLKSQLETDVSFEGSTSQQKLLANLAAQIIAFALGKKSDNPHKAFHGGRPSSLLYAPQLTPKALGALLAHFENKVMFQGFLWNINSFDQEGVQLGKQLATAVLRREASAELEAYVRLLKLF